MRAGLFHRSNFGNVNHLFPFDTFNSVYDCAISNFVKVLDFSVLFICQLFCRGFSFTSLLHDLSHRSFRIILIALSFRQDLFDSIVPLLLPLLDLFFNLACPLVKNLLNLELGVALNLTLFENFYQPNFAFLLNPPITLCNLLLVFSFFLFKISQKTFVRHLSFCRYLGFAAVIEPFHIIPERLPFFVIHASNGYFELGGPLCLGRMRGGAG
mmetsp:Transcript_43243/g.94176  ORF Transcript_43243/g.94176 Transcript_43243/m.94176 type:complete len:212 (-) Transcript_43243:354-989(-)